MGSLQRHMEVARKACVDPGSIVARRGDEDVAEWQAHAVVTALDCRGLLRHPDDALCIEERGWHRGWEAGWQRCLAKATNKLAEIADAGSVADALLVWQQQQGRVEGGG